jgi:predicted phage terminase large subunit-like protein
MAETGYRPTLKQVEAAVELKARRGARRSLGEFTQFIRPAYQLTWYHDLICNWLEKLTARKMLENLMIFAPPRHGKSELVCRNRPAWAIGCDRTRHFMTVAYGDKLAAEFSEAVINIMRSPNYTRLFQNVTFKSTNVTAWEVDRLNPEDDDQTPTMIAAGIMSAMTGQGATDLEVDDPIKNHEEAYSQLYREKVWNNYMTTAGTRLAPGGRKVIVMTRWHDDDLAGRLMKLALADKKADQWVVISLAAVNDDGQQSFIWNTRTGEKVFMPKYEALWPEAYPREYLDTQRANLGEVFFSAMYQQRPTTAKGTIFRRDNWSYYDTRPEIDFLVQVYDTANEKGQDNDYSASITLGSGVAGFPIFDAWRDKVTFPFLVERVYRRWDECGRLYGRYPDRVLVEAKASGVQLLQQIDTNNLAGAWVYPDGQLRRVPKIPMVAMPATASKEVRARGISGYHESKLCLLPSKAPWLVDFIDELALFPKGAHDDWTDTFVHGVTYMTRPIASDEEEHILVQEEEVSISRDLDEFDMNPFVGLL